MAVEVRELVPRQWGVSVPVVAYCNAHRAIVRASDMRPGLAGACWDQHGSHGTRAVVCIDCKQDGREVPVQLPQYTDRAPFFRHWRGMAPGTSGHGETAEHIGGKLLIADWAAEQDSVLPWTVTEELWNPGVRLRSDVKARLLSGREVAFEVQRKDLAAGEWERRHGGYQQAGIADVWLWPPDAPRIELDLPGTSVVIDVENERAGVLVADYDGRYLHPTSAEYAKKPTHYASAPLADWALSEQGRLVPPPELDDFIGMRPASERRALAERFRRNPYAHLAREKRPGPSSEPKPYATTAKSILHIRVRQAELSPAENGLMKAVLRRVRDQRDVMALGLYAAATAAPNAFRRMGERMLVANREEIEVWCAVMRHCESVLGNPDSTLASLVEAVEVQATVMETGLSLVHRPVKDAPTLIALRREATRGIRHARSAGVTADAAAITYVVWAARVREGAPQFSPEDEAQAVELVAKNLPTLVNHRGAVRAAVLRGKSVREAAAAVLAGSVR